MHPRVLIVGTVPYDTKESSRAFDAYFHYWEKENIAQIFSNSKEPCKGHCGTLFQITDSMMLNRWLHKTEDIGKIFFYDNRLHNFSVFSHLSFQILRLLLIFINEIFVTSSFNIFCISFILLGNI